MAIGSEPITCRVSACEAVQFGHGEAGSGSYKTFVASTGRSSGRVQLAAVGVACLALALIALTALSSDAPAKTELSVEHARERMSPDANMLNKLLTREEAADKAQLAASKQQLSDVKVIAQSTRPPASLQGAHSPLSFPSADPPSATATAKPAVTHKTAAAVQRAPVVARPQTVRSSHPAASLPATPLHTAAARVVQKQQVLKGAPVVHSHVQAMGDDGWRDHMVRNDAAAQYELPGYEYVMGAKAEKALLKGSLAASEDPKMKHVVHEDAQFRMDGGMFRDKKTVTTPGQQVPLYQNFW